MSDKKEMNPEDKLTFGKYRGVTIRQLINYDKEYLEWLIQDDIILLSNEAYSEYNKV